MVLDAIVVFISGAVYEAGCVGWVHFSEKRRPVITALFSMGVALAQLIGIDESIHDMRIAPFFVIGYGFGTFVAVSMKAKREGN